MATYTETFPNNGTLGTTTEDLTWLLATPGTGPTITGGQAVAPPPADGGTLRAEHSITGTDFFVQVESLTQTTQGFLELWAGFGNGADPFDDPNVVYTQIVDRGVGQGTEILVQEFVTFSYIIPNTVFASDSFVATWRFEVEGNTARVLRNGVEMCSGLGVNVARPLGFKGGLGAFSSAVLDNFTFGDLGDSSDVLPAITSDIPFLVANDRYQTVVLADAGTTTTPPEFRYWYAAAPEWSLDLNE